MQLTFRAANSRKEITRRRSYTYFPTNKSTVLRVISHSYARWNSRGISIARDHWVRLKLWVPEKSYHSGIIPTNVNIKSAIKKRSRISSSRERRRDYRNQNYTMKSTVITETSRRNVWPECLTVTSGVERCEIGTRTLYNLYVQPCNMGPSLRPSSHAISLSTRFTGKVVTSLP